MLIIGGGIITGSLGMWSFYSSLSLSDNLGVTLAIAFAFSPIAGTVTGLIKGDQHMDLKTALGLISIIIGIVLLQLSRKTSDTANQKAHPSPSILHHYCHRIGNLLIW